MKIIKLTQKIITKAKKIITDILENNKNNYENN